MKKLIIISMMMVLVLSLGAQTDVEVKTLVKDSETQEILEEVQLEIDEAMEEVKDATGLDLKINIVDTDLDSNSAYMGVFHAELKLQKMQELKYNKFYGVLITGIGDNSPADFFRLAKDDIVMQIDEYKIDNSKDFSKKLKLFRAGDEVKLKIFRFGEEKTIDFVFGSRDTIIKKEGEKFVLTQKSSTKTDKKKKLSAGSGGGSWLPVWFMADFTDINSMLAQNGLEEINQLELGDYSGIIMHGGGGKGNVGKGFMLGGMGAGYSFEKSTKIADTDYIRKVYYELGYGGVTLDKRFALTRKLVIGAGFMLGGGHQSIKLSQTDGDFNWQFTDTTQISDSNVITMKRDYFLFQPKAVAMYRILDWLAIRAEGGYMMSHATSSGWQANFAGTDYSIEGSPNTSLDGFTFTIGPWFGF